MCWNCIFSQNPFDDILPSPQTHGITIVPHVHCFRSSIPCVADAIAAPRRFISAVSLFPFSVWGWRRLQDAGWVRLFVQCSSYYHTEWCVLTIEVHETATTTSVAIQCCFGVDVAERRPPCVARAWELWDAATGDYTPAADDVVFIHYLQLLYAKLECTL